MVLDQAGGRATSVNGAVKRRVSDVVGIIPCVVFTPDFLDVVKGSAAGRRAALDLLGSQVSQPYAKLVKEYERAIKQRNQLLKRGAADSEMEPWNEALVQHGARLTVHRARLAAKLMDCASAVYEDVSGGEVLAAGYEPDSLPTSPENWFDDEQAVSRTKEVLRRAVASRAADERTRCVSLVGPHRDDLRITIQGRDARAFASQGQQRTVALAWKLAEVDIVASVTGRMPIVLLDDVMSELDKERRRALTERVGARVQTVITTTNTGYFDKDLLERALLVEVCGAH